MVIRRGAGGATLCGRRRARAGGGARALLTQAGFAIPRAGGAGGRAGGLCSARGAPAGRGQGAGDHARKFPRPAGAGGAGIGLYAPGGGRPAGLGRAARGPRGRAGRRPSPAPPPRTACLLQGALRAAAGEAVPETDVKEIEAGMIRLCGAAGRAAAGGPGAPRGGAARELIDLEGKLRQRAAASIRRGDREELVSCLGAYARACREYVLSYPGEGAGRGTFLASALASLDHLMEGVPRDDDRAVSCLIGTYTALGDASAERPAACAPMRNVEDTVLAACMRSLSAIGSGQAPRVYNAAAREAVGHIWRMGAAACAKYGNDHGAAAAALRVAEAAIERGSRLDTPLIAACAALRITYEMIHASDFGSAKRAASATAAAVGRLCSAGLTAWPVSHELGQDVYLRVTDCAVRALGMEAGQAARRGWGAGSRGSVIGDLIRIAGGLAAAPRQHADRPACNVGMMCLSAIAWMASYRPDGTDRGECHKEMGGITRWLEKAHAAGMADPGRIAACAAKIALYGCAYWHGNVVDKCIKIVSVAAKKVADMRSGKWLLSMMDVIGCCTAGIDEGICRQAADCWAEMAEAYAGRHGEGPPSDTLPDMEKAMFEAWSNSMLLPRETEQLAPRPDEKIRGMLTAESLDRFDGMKRRYTGPAWRPRGGGG